jgi:hypothetical protein
MTWTTPQTWVAGSVVSAAQLNEQLRDNLTYLLSRPHQRIIRNAGYSTTSTSFVDIDSTNLSITLTLSSGAVLVGLEANVSYDAGGGSRPVFDITIDGARYANAVATGLGGITGPSGAFTAHLSFTVLVVGLTVGSHVFRPVWRNSVTGATSLVSPVVFWALEVA